MSIFHRKKKEISSPKSQVIEEKQAVIKKEEKPIVPRILVYGIDQVNLENPAVSVNTSNYNLEFASFGTDKKFQDYDGVILFQGIFEEVERIHDYLGTSRFNVKYHRDELVKRRNQLSQLLENGGFVCFLIHRHFVDRSEYGVSFTETDLCKIYLNISNFYREPLSSEYLITKIYRSEFEPFLKNYGIARVKFSYHSSWLESNIRKVCDVNYDTVGFIMLNSHYFLPCRLPAKDEVGDFFSRLVSSLVATSKKLIQEIPSWVDEYRFKEEEKILGEEIGLQNRIEELSRQKDIYRRYKRCLCYDGDLLVESVEGLLKEGLGFILDNKKDEKIEDKVVLDADKNELALIEIKGMNDNIKNPNVYQADSHRGRRNKASSFPSILIANTFIKSSNSLTDKMRELNSEQIKLAVEKKVLVMRTIDLLNLLFLKEQGKINDGEVVGIFTKKYGWLNVSQEGYKIQEE